jgi:5'-methylthioadenosine phosphorylase
VKQEANLIGIFGGSGFSRFLDDVELAEVKTPYGDPSDRVAIGQVEGVKVAFIPRHGSRHTIPPAAINYRANLWAMRDVGVTRVMGPCAAGSLQPHVKPGDMVICDQFVDRTWGRCDTFYSDGPEVAHLSAADPYCPELRQVAARTASELGLAVHPQGAVVVVQGPRFSTRAESRWFASQGWEVINMTQYPEVVLARELELCYVNIALITDYDVGLEAQPGVPAVSTAEVERTFASNNERLRQLLLKLIPAISAERSCGCSTAMSHAFVGGQG